MLTLCLLLLLTTAALAAPQEIDLETMTAEELNTLIDQARLALADANTVADGSILILDELGVKAYLTGAKVEYNGLYLNMTVENGSDTEIWIRIEDVYVNGWGVSPTASSQIAAGKKWKGTPTIYSMENADVQSDEDLQDIEFTVQLMDITSFTNLYKSETPLRLTFPIAFDQ